MNVARNSRFKVHVDFEKSRGVHLFDKTTDSFYVDFFGMYASLPLGYNHPVFDTEEYRNKILQLSKSKVCNCEFLTDASVEFDKRFTEYASNGEYSHFHYCCTGALAVEAAIKTAIVAKKHKDPKILSFRNSFHGINSYGGFVTSRFEGANKKLEGFPEPYSIKSEVDIDEVRKHFKNNKLTAVLVEPIQCSGGDRYISNLFFSQLQELCTKHSVPLIFDEIQVGFGVTGKKWFYEHTNIVPDIVVFGKKTQLSGIMVRDEFGAIFEPDQVTKLEVTWNADVVDMARCTQIIEAYEKENVLKNVAEMGNYMLYNLQSFDKLVNVRGVGLLLAFDLPDTKTRDKFAHSAFKNGFLCNPTSSKSVRLRPPLNLNKTDADTALLIIKQTLKRI